MTLAPPEPFRHEALLYAGPEDFVRRTVPFIREGLAAQEPVMVAAIAERLALLRGALGEDADRVRFADMGDIGANPAHIIPAWRSFVSEGPGPSGRLRGIGEPIHTGRGPAETVECQLHESLLNLAFGDAAGFHLLCPYDTASLDPAVVHEARCSHPIVSEHGSSGDSEAFRGADAVFAAFETPLPPPSGPVTALSFGVGSLREVRALVDRAAVDAGLAEDRRRNLVLAVHEVAANSVCHAGGLGVLRVWSEDGAVVAEVRDRGRLRDPLAGRHAPAPDQLGGWGLWIANHATDLFQLRHEAEGSVVRLTVRRR